MILILTVSGSLPVGMTAFPVMAAETDAEETDDSGEEVITEEEREVYPRTDTQGEEAESPEGEAVADEDPDIVEESAYDPDDPMVLRIAENYGVSAEEVEEMVRNGEIGVGSASELLAGLKGNGLSHDGRFAKCTKRWGIDVSYWNGSNIGKTINWTKVREAGCEFAIIRCGYTRIWFRQQAEIGKTVQGGPDKGHYRFLRQGGKGRLPRGHLRQQILLL